MAWRRRSSHPNMNINELDYSISHEICQNFDVDRTWEQLAAVIGYSTHQMKVIELEKNRTDGSPSRTLLWDWGTRGGTVRDLYYKLDLLGKTHAMRLLEPIMTIGKQEKTAEVKHDVDVPTIKEVASNSSLSSSSSTLNNETVSYDPTCLPKPPPPHRPTSKPEDINLNKNQENDGKSSSNKHFVGKEIQLEKKLPGTSSEQVAGEKFYPSGGGASSVCSNNCQAEGEPASGKGNMGAASSSAPPPTLERVKSMAEEYGTGLNKDEKDIAVAMLGTLNFTYKELSQATDGFNVERKLGEGSFGVVYKGVATGSNVAIKRLFQKIARNDGNSQYTHLSSELKALTRFRHENIVPLYGYALDGDEVCLVYQYMWNGSLEDCLHRKNSKSSELSWGQRINIANGAACGIQYLHNVDTSPLIHGDIKSANILLDRHFDARIGDLGMAQHATASSVAGGALTHITKKQQGSTLYRSIGYMAPEIQRGNHISIKGDTYAFGVVLFELLTGLEVHDPRREGSDAAFLVGYIQQEEDNNPNLDYQTTFQDQKVEGICPKLVFDGIFQLANKCTNDVKKERLTMTEVHSQLKEFETKFHQPVPQDHCIEKKMAQMTLKADLPVPTPPSPNNSPYCNHGDSPALLVTGPPSDTAISQGSSNGVVSPGGQFEADQPLPGPLRLQLSYDKKKVEDHVYANISPATLPQLETTNSNTLTNDKKSDETKVSNEGLPKADMSKLNKLQKFDKENMAGSKFDEHNDVSPHYANLPSEVYSRKTNPLSKVKGQMDGGGDTGPRQEAPPVCPPMCPPMCPPVVDHHYVNSQGVPDPQESEYKSEPNDCSIDNNESVPIGSAVGESVVKEEEEQQTRPDEGRTANREMMALFNNYQRAVGDELGDEVQENADLDEYCFNFQFDNAEEEESSTLTEDSQLFATEEETEHVYVNVQSYSTAKHLKGEDTVVHHQKRLAEYEALCKGEGHSTSTEADSHKGRQLNETGCHDNNKTKEPSEGDCYD